MSYVCEESKSSFRNEFATLDALLHFLLKCSNPQHFATRNCMNESLLYRIMTLFHYIEPLNWNWWLWQLPFQPVFFFYPHFSIRLTLLSFSFKASNAWLATSWHTSKVVLIDSTSVSSWAQKQPLHFSRFNMHFHPPQPRLPTSSSSLSLPPWIP